MTMKEKWLILSIFVKVLLAFVLTHAADHLMPSLQNFFALILPASRW